MFRFGLIYTSLFNLFLIFFSFLFFFSRIQHFASFLWYFPLISIHFNIFSVLLFLSSFSILQWFLFAFFCSLPQPQTFTYQLFYPILPFLTISHFFPVCSFFFIVFFMLLIFNHTIIWHYQKKRVFFLKYFKSKILLSEKHVFFETLRIILYYSILFQFSVMSHNLLLAKFSIAAFFLIFVFSLVTEPAINVAALSNFSKLNSIYYPNRKI